MNKRPLNHPNSIELSRERIGGKTREKQEQKEGISGLAIEKSPLKILPLKLFSC